MLTRILAALLLLVTGCAEQSTRSGESSDQTSVASSLASTKASRPITTRASSPTTTVSVPTTTRNDRPSGAPFEVLVFHKTAEFRHGSIPAAIEALVALGDDRGFSTSVTDDAGVFTSDALADYDVVVFLNTTGDILNRSQEEAFEAFISDDNGFVGIHAAADTEYDWEWYGELIGSYFHSHPQPQTATVRIADTTHPATDGLPETFERFDEWYNFRSQLDPTVTVLATLDESSYEGGSMGSLHPITWAHEYGGGRSFYTGFGHTADSFSDPLVLEHLGNGILWAGGVAASD